MKAAVVRLICLCPNLAFLSLVLTSICDAKLDMEGVVAVWLLNEGSGNKVTDFF